MTKETRIAPTMANESASPPAILRPGEAASLLLVSEQWLKVDRMAGGSVPFFRVGRQVRYRRSDILEWIESQVTDGRVA